MRDGGAPSIVDPLLTRRPAAAADLGRAAGTVPACISHADRWEMLLWAAITCAEQWHC